MQRETAMPFNQTRCFLDSLKQDQFDTILRMTRVLRYLQFTALLTLIFCVQNSSSETIFGFNQGWFKNNYGGQWMESYDHKEAERLLNLTKQSGATHFRIWLFEGLDPAGIEWTNGMASGISKKYLDNLESFLKLAKQKGITISLALFDGNVVSQRSNVPPEKVEQWNRIFRGTQGAHKAFQGNVLEPVLKLIEKPEYKGVVGQIDIANEVNALTKTKKPFFDVSDMGVFICDWYHSIKRRTQIPVTASLGWADAVDELLRSDIPTGCVDYYDIHIYNDSGSIPRCEELKRLTLKLGKKIQLGEFGQSSTSYSDQIQQATQKNFVDNALNCGLSGIFAWRLSDIREGNNPEARFSYEAFGKTRPAYKDFTDIIAQKQPVENLKKKMLYNIPVKVKSGSGTTADPSTHKTQPEEKSTP